MCNIKHMNWFIIVYMILLYPFSQLIQICSDKKNYNILIIFNIVYFIKLLKWKLYITLYLFFFKYNILIYFKANFKIGSKLKIK